MKKQLIITVTHPDKYPATQFIDIAIKSVLTEINADCDEGWSVSYQDEEGNDAGHLIVEEYDQ
jgi:hypothetical protein